VGSVCRIKRFTHRWQTFLWWRRGWNGGAAVAKTAIKRLLCYGFRHTGKAMEQVYQCWWRICREISVFSRFWYHMYYVLYPVVAYLPTLPRNLVNINWEKPPSILVLKWTEKYVLCTHAHTHTHTHTHTHKVKWGRNEICEAEGHGSINWTPWLESASELYRPTERPPLVGEVSG
jgi:hypothetical protein